MIDFKSLFNDTGVPSIEKGKHSRPGWIQVHCPFCLDGSSYEKYHGGFNIEGEYYNCWKCGYRPLYEVLPLLFNTTAKEAKAITKRYKEDSPPITKEEKKRIGIEKFSLPPYCQKMDCRHRDYLRKRGFDSERLEAEWNLVGTSHCGDYKLRVIAPITLDGKVVSYQGRDITDKAKLKYKACPMKTEVVHHKDIVYGFDKLNETRRKDRCIIVEGVFDAWRLGAGAVATFGIGFTIKQVLFLAKRKIKTAFIMYDPEEKAQDQAEKLSIQLNGLGVKSKIIDISKEGVEDPGTLSENKARQIKKDLLG